MLQNADRNKKINAVVSQTGRVVSQTGKAVGMPAMFFFFAFCVMSAGRSGLAVACLTAVRKVLGSNRALGSCVYRKNRCDLQPWARAVCTFPAVPRSTQPSTLRGTVNEYPLSG